MIMKNKKQIKSDCRRFWPAIFILAIFMLQACASAPPPPPPVSKGQPKPYRVGKTWYKPVSKAKGFRQKGVASWYGKKFHGRKTSNGETYNMYAMTAAHKTLPFGTWVRVHNLENNQKVTVRINDRGPFVRNRILDLSYTGAKKLGMVGPGTARVEIVALGAKQSKGPKQPYVATDYYSGKFTFQVGAFSSRQNAEKLVARLDEKYANAHISPFDRGDRIFYRVRVGMTRTLDQAVEYESYLINNGYPQAFIVAE